MYYLSDLTPGEVAYIESTPRAKRRLIELGLIGGTRIECVAAAPFGDARAYLIRGAVIALRRSEAEQICVQRMPHASKMPFGFRTPATLNSESARWG